MKISLSLVPLIPILLGVVVGTICDSIFPTIFIAAFLACAIIAFLTKRNTIAIVLLSTTLGWGNTTIHNAPLIEPQYIDKDLVFAGTVNSVVNKDEIRTIIVEIDEVYDSTIHHIKPIKSCLYIPSLNPVVEKGDRITYRGQLEYLKDRRDLPYEFNVVEHYNRKGIYTSSFIQPENISITGHDNRWIWKLQNFREDISHLIASLPLSEGCIEFLNATITGDTSMIGEEQRIKYSASGLAHILALSGLHVGIITFFVTFLLYPIDLIRGRKMRYIITLIILWIYAIMTGLSPSVTRAVIMATVFLTAHILQRHHSPFNSLCLAAIIVLIISPQSLFDIGFQLSFTAVASILLLSKHLNPISRRHCIAYNFVSIMSVSTAAMIGTGIISAFYFHNFPIYFLLANIIASYLLPIIIIGGLFALLLSVLGISPLWICSGIEFCYNLIDSLTVFITNLPGAQIDNIYFKGWLLIPYFATLGCLLFTIHIKKRMWWVLTIAIGIFSLSMGYIAQPRHCTTEFFIPRNSYYTDIIVRDSTAMYIVSTSRGGDSIDAYDKCIDKYADYIGWHKVDTITRVPANFSAKRLYRKEQIVIIGDYYIYIVDDDSDLCKLSNNPRYALVCRGFKGDILDVKNVINPDTILLSGDLHKKRHLKYADSCRVHNIPYISLRDTCFHRVIIK